MADKAPPNPQQILNDLLYRVEAAQAKLDAATQTLRRIKKLAQKLKSAAAA